MFFVLKELSFATPKEGLGYGGHKKDEKNRMDGEKTRKYLYLPYSDRL